MKPLMILTLLSLLSLSSFASASTNFDTRPALAMMKALSSDKTPQQAKAMLNAILNGQEYEKRVSVIESESASALGKTYVMIIIGTDNLEDDDNGWSSTYQLNIELQRTQEGSDQDIVEVKFQPIAG
jgi:hypothetical protein